MYWIVERRSELSVALILSISIRPAEPLRAVWITDFDNRVQDRKLVLTVAAVEDDPLSVGQSFRRDRVSALVDRQRVVLVRAVDLDRMQRPASPRKTTPASVPDALTETSTRLPTRWMTKSSSSESCPWIAGRRVGADLHR